MNCSHRGSWWWPVLEPGDRRLLFETLRPPDGYRMDQAILTTYPLDLLTLLTLPLSFTSFDLEDKDGRPTATPQALLETLRRYADKLTIFCQAGQISVPRKRQLLNGYLEQAVVEVAAPRGGIFHPKVAILRYLPADEDAMGPVIYRMLCSSRNLTFDRSWDTVLTLEGNLTKRRKAFARNRALSEFVQALPGLAVRPLPEQVHHRAAKMADELLRVQFMVPEGFDNLVFWPVGHTNVTVWPFKGRIDRMLIMSPFITPGLLKRISDVSRSDVLISRHEQLDRLKSAVVKRFDQCYCLDEAAESTAGDETDTATSQEHANEAEDSPADQTSEEDSIVVDTVELSGLHAKLYIANSGKGARIWTGSANATDAAFKQNVEFMVELVSTKRRHRLEELIPQGNNGDSELTFAHLLTPYLPTPTEEPDTQREELRRLLDEARRELAVAGLQVQVVTCDGNDPPRYQLEVHLDPHPQKRWPKKVRAIRCWPTTLKFDAAQKIGDHAKQPLMAFGPLDFESITSFFAFEIEAKHRAIVDRVRFVLNLPLLNAPADRKDRLLLAMLKNKTQVLHYLLMLLAGDNAPGRPRLDHGPSMWFDEGDEELGATEPPMSALPLLEPLLETLHSDPERLKQIEHLRADLVKTEEGRAMLPDGFEEVWPPIWAARKELT